MIWYWNSWLSLSGFLLNSVFLNNLDLCSRWVNIQNILLSRFHINSRRQSAKLRSDPHFAIIRLSANLFLIFNTFSSFKYCNYDGVWTLNRYIPFWRINGHLIPQFCITALAMKYFFWGCECNFKSICSSNFVSQL